jgi:hypothetical protein
LIDDEPTQQQAKHQGRYAGNHEDWDYYLHGRA